MVAARDGKLEKVKKYLQRGVDVNFADKVRYKFGIKIVPFLLFAGLQCSLFSSLLDADR